MAFLGWGDPWRPLREMERLSRTLDDLLVRGRPAVQSWLPFSEFPPVNVYATPDAVIVEAELPGLTADAIDLSVTSDMLVLRGARKAEGAEAKVSYHRRERPVGQFVRSINLPDRVQTDKVEAKFSDGVLTVTLPKAEEAKVHKIAVSGGK